MVNKTKKKSLQQTQVKPGPIMQTPLSFATYVYAQPHSLEQYLSLASPFIKALAAGECFVPGQSNDLARLGRVLWCGKSSYGRKIVGSV